MFDERLIHPQNTATANVIACLCGNKIRKIFFILFMSLSFLSFDIFWVVIVFGHADLAGLLLCSSDSWKIRFWMFSSKRFLVSGCIYWEN
jgi:hypothetical protein